MNSLIRDKKGAVLPIRTSGRKEKGGWLKLFMIVALIVVAGLFTMGAYNKWASPWLSDKGITSSLENPGNGGTNTIEGSTTQYLDRPDAASFSFITQDAANDNAIITAGIPVGGLSKVVGTDGKETTKEWFTPSSVNTSQTVTTVPEDTILSLYGGDGTYYLEPLTNHKLTVGDKISMTAATIQTEANMVVTIYDDTGATALSAADDATNHDYKLTMGQGQKEAVYIKLSNNAADKRYDIKAICTGAAGTNVSTLDIKGADWTKGIVPDFIDNAVVSANKSESGALVDEEYDNCFVYKLGSNDVLSLDEWEDTPLIKASVEATTSGNPAADVVFLTFLDGAWKRGSDGLGHFDFYQHDSAEANVGLAETVNSPLGKQLGAIIELD